MTTTMKKANIRLEKISKKISPIEYEITNDNPINPFGRTGLIGRGLLGRWGPNHAADPIVTKYCRISLSQIKFKFFYL